MTQESNRCHCCGTITTLDYSGPEPRCPGCKLDSGCCGDAPPAIGDGTHDGIGGFEDPGK